MKIYCKGCSKHLGEIREGTLHKKIIYLCPVCDTKRIALELKYQNKNDYKGDSFMKDFFGEYM